MSDLDFFTAYDAATPLFTSSATVALVTGAERSGLLAALSEPRSPAEAAAASGLTEDRAAAVCGALAALDVLTRVDSRFELSPVWKALAAPGGFVALPVLLAGLDVRARLLTSLGEGGDYWSMPSQDRVTYARSVSPDPFSDELVAGFRAAAEVDPDSAALAAGGRILELGCGVAGRLLTYLRAFPALQGVGVELADDLAEVARDRARQLGVADRLRVVNQDARDFDEAESFDFGFWSQFFFPDGTRKAALATLLRCLRPGAVAFAPCAADFDAIAADPTGAEARYFAVEHLIYQSWGVTVLSYEALAEEFTAAGFTDVTIQGAGGPGPARVRAVRP